MKKNVKASQYSYDCSNIYCGPNAARDSDVTFQDINARRGKAAKRRFLLEKCTLGVFDNKLAKIKFAVRCGACEESVVSLSTSVTCEPQCLGGEIVA